MEVSNDNYIKNCSILARKATAQVTNRPCFTLIVRGSQQYITRGTLVNQFLSGMLNLVETKKEMSEMN